MHLRTQHFYLLLVAVVDVGVVCLFCFALFFVSCGVCVFVYLFFFFFCLFVFALE